MATHLHEHGLHAFVLGFLLPHKHQLLSSYRRYIFSYKLRIYYLPIINLSIFSENVKHIFLIYHIMYNCLIKLSKITLHV